MPRSCRTSGEHGGGDEEGEDMSEWEEDHGEDESMSEGDGSGLSSVSGDEVHSHSSWKVHCRRQYQWPRAPPPPIQPRCQQRSVPSVSLLRRKDPWSRHQDI